MPFPMMSNARAIRKHDFGAHEAVLLTDIKSVGMVQYLYALQVLKKGEERPVLWITSEANMMARMGGGSHFLCAFHNGQHLNFGSSDDWANLDAFEAAALEKVRERLAN